MGAGVSREAERKAKYRSLRRTEKELRQAGVSCEYSKMRITGDGFAVHYGQTVRASNGEAFGNMIVEVNGETYSFLNAQTGLKRIMALYGNDEYRATKPITDLALLVMKVEQAVKSRDNRKVFLYNPDGTLFLTEECLGMKPGQLYAYNEMKDDRPMLRIGQGVSKEDYTEFLPGMSVRYGDGAVIAERPA